MRHKNSHKPVNSPKMEARRGRGPSSGGAARKRPARARAWPWLLTRAVGFHTHQSACDLALGRPSAGHAPPVGPPAAAPSSESSKTLNLAATGDRRARTCTRAACVRQPEGPEGRRGWVKSATNLLRYTRSRCGNKHSRVYAQRTENGSRNNAGPMAVTPTCWGLPCVYPICWTNQDTR